MKKSILLYVSLLFTTVTFSQNVGINATGAAPNASAMLDVNSNNKGLLIPRVALTAANSNAPIGAGIAVSLLVYNTATAGTGINAVTPGYYYWDGTRWVSTAGTDWRITGNAGTTAGTHFLGTTDNVGLDFRTNNTIRMRLLGNGQVGINTAAPAGVDMFSVTATNAINYAINGYCNTTPLGAGVYGFSSNVTNQKAAVWGDINSTNAQASAVLGQYLQATGAGNGVYGFTNSTSAVGVRGYKPAGGLGWGGLFLNDLGYTGFFGLASDEKLKTNIRPISNSLSVINSIKVYSYHYDINKYPNLGDSTLHFGVMAQELEVILPNLVKTKNIDLHNTQANEKDKKVDYKEPEQVKTVNYLELVPILIQGIQEQQQIINAQQQQIDSLNTRLNKLEEKE